MLLALHQGFGLEGIELIDGDFAYVIVDHDSKEVVLARDFFGCRPLYYVMLPGGGLAFASEYKALLALPEVEPEIDRDMVQYLQCAKHLPVGRTLFTGIAEATPGAALRMTSTGGITARHECPPLTLDVRVTAEEEAVDLVRRTLVEAVRRRSTDIDQIGLALSGGIDSIALAYLLRQLHPDKEIHTFTAGAGPDDPEIVTARKVAAKIGATHHDVLTPPELLDSGLRDLVWHLEDPYARSEAMQLLQLGRFARHRVDVLLTAQGSDLLFAGSPKSLVFYLMRLLPPCRSGLHQLYDLTQLSLPPHGVVGKLLDRLYARGKVPSVPSVPGAHLPARTVLPPMQPEFVNANLLAEFQLSPKFERTFAASGLEHRSPFLDVDLARAAFSITDALKIRRRINKYVLRKALATIVDDEFCGLAKFPQRMRYDLAFAETLDRIAAEPLSDANVRRRGLFEPASIRALFVRPPGQPYSAEAAMRIWTALLTEYWAELFVDDRAGLRAADQDAAAAT